MGEQRGLAPLLTVDLAPVTVELNLRESGARFPCKWSSVLEIYNEAKKQEWNIAIQECRSSGLSVSEWCQQRGVTTTTYYRWERELLTGVQRNGTPPSTTVTFAELPAPKQVSRNVAERCATLHIGSASLDIYSGCDAEQLKMLVELLRPC